MRKSLPCRMYQPEGAWMMYKKHWYDNLWIWSVIYFILGFFNIMFAWLGMIDFLLPIILAVAGGNKWFCNNLCGRGQLFALLGGKFKLSRNIKTPKWLVSKWFRYLFLVFFLTMFGVMVFNTYLVAGGAKNLSESIKLLWTFNVPWGWAYSQSTLPEWVVQFAFGFYGLMLTSAIIGIVAMLLFKPRTWCAFCPMGTMTQMICKVRASEVFPSKGIDKKIEK